MAKDWTVLFQKYHGKWVALAEDETTVLAAAETARQAHDSAGVRQHFLYRVPDTLEAFAGYAI